MVEVYRSEAFIAESAIERFDERVVGGLARTGEIDLHSPLVGPQIRRLISRKIKTSFCLSKYDVDTWAGLWLAISVLKSDSIHFGGNTASQLHLKRHSVLRR
jgi:hypothetical protein